MESYVNQCLLVLPAASAPMSVAAVILAADASRLPQAHQVLAQVKPVPAFPVAGSNGTTGFVGEGIRVSNKRTDVRGVPPRGRPV